MKVVISKNIQIDTQMTPDGRNMDPKKTNNLSKTKHLGQAECVERLEYTKTKIRRLRRRVSFLVVLNYMYT